MIENLQFFVFRIDSSLGEKIDTIYALKLNNGANIAVPTTGGTLALFSDITKANAGLGNCDNTSDANKPISTATQTALNAKANDTEAVHLANAETITGLKTLVNNLTFTTGAYVSKNG